jgi:RNA polymerase sigma factor (TIGR02999 family)
MRRILVDHARSRHYQKRGGDAVRVTLDEALVVASEPDQDFVALDDALTALEAVDARKSQVVEMRFFGGLTIEETAEALQISRDTVKRDWNIAKLCSWANCEPARTMSSDRWRQVEDSSRRTGVRAESARRF